MWDCTCGCTNIAGDLTFCPHCFKEREMPRIPAGAMPSNDAAAEGEPGYVPDESGAQQEDQNIEGRAPEHAESVEVSHGENVEVTDVTVSDSQDAGESGSDAPKTRKAGK
jgi:hypothetical protein